jgi:hypothetical protein
MRKRWWGGVVLGLVLAPAGVGRAENQKAVTAVINRAIKAVGGRAKLAKLQAATFKVKGKLKEGGKEIPFTLDASAQGLDQWRLELSAEENGRTFSFVLVFNKNKGWGKDANQVEALPKGVVPFLRGDTYALRLAQLLVPLKDKECKLSSLGELKIGNQPAVGIKAARKGFPEVDIYFDKKSGLPVKVLLNVKESEGEKAHSWLLGAPKKVAGVKQFTQVKFTRDNKELLTAEISDLEAKDKLDAGTFGKPD